MAPDTALLDEQQDVRTIIEAFICEAAYSAKLAAQFLDGWTNSLGMKKPCLLPAEFLLETAAVIRIAIWQKSGIATAMNADFPPAAELLQVLVRRLFNEPTSFCLIPGSCPAPLARRVHELWFRHCSWDAPRLLGVDIVVRLGDPEALMKALVDLLSSRRH